MASTTLVTFLLQAPPSTTSVNLLGSWDNFCKPYPMQKDQRMGHGHWRGCHSFLDIICDGESLQLSDSRDGALKMGGKYWYYYQLNGDLEYHNPAEPSTTSCPFLPGQEVNVLEVPIQIKTSHSTNRRRSSSSSISAGFTLNPEDKYISPKPPVAPVILRRVTSTSNIEGLRNIFNTKFANPTGIHPPSASESPYNSVPTQPGSIGRYPSTDLDEITARSAPGSRRTSLWAAFSQIRNARSTTPSLDLNMPPRSQSRGMTVSTNANGLSNHKGVTCEPSAESRIHPCSPRQFASSEAPEKSPECLFDRAAQLAQDVSSTVPSLHEPISTSYSTPRIKLDGLSDESDHGTLVFRESAIVGGLCNAFEAVEIQDASSNPTGAVVSGETSKTFERKGLLLKAASITQKIPNGPLKIFGALHNGAETFFDSEIKTEPYQHADSLSSSYATSGLFSPSLSSATALTGYLSPIHLGQPDTPTISEFEGGFLGGGEHGMERSICGNNADDTHMNTTLAKPEGAYGYKLPEEEHASALTLLNLEGTTPKVRRGDSPFEQKSGNDLVESWNDGTEHRMTAMEELVNDLGYLGRMIV